MRAPGRTRTCGQPLRRRLLCPLSYGGSAFTLTEPKDRFTVLFPATEHAPFDLVAYAAGEFHRLQVRYRSARAGAVKVHFRSMWPDRNGTHTTLTDKNAVDVVCVYCPETDDCYYIRPAEHGASVSLRITSSRNGQQLGVLDAAAFRELTPKAHS